VLNIDRQATKNGEIVLREEGKVLLPEALADDRQLLASESREEVRMSR